MLLVVPSLIWLQLLQYVTQFSKYITHFSDIECFTKSGPETGKPCAFPFTYQGKTYEKCTEIDNDQLWCSTMVDPNGIHVRGRWGNCDHECNSGKVSFNS